MVSIIKNEIRKQRTLYKILRNIYALTIGLWGYFIGKIGAKEHIKSTISLICRKAEILGKPINITIEPTNQCNCRCTVCETGSGILGRPAANMNLEQFKTVIDRIGKHINTLMFYFMGEPFINKDSYEMIRYAKEKGIPFITTCTNGDLVDPAKLITTGIDEINFQIGGITQETHEVYRQGSNLKRVLDNLQQLLYLRKKTGIKMKINVGFILMKHNEHEVETFIKIMREFKVDEATIIDPCVRNIEQGRLLLPNDKKHWIYDPICFEKGILMPRVRPNNECPWINYSLTILVNGDVVPCCRDTAGKYVMGNIFKQSLEEIWNNALFINFRSKIYHEQNTVELCRLCSGYGVSLLK